MSEPPRRIAIDHDDYHASYVGKTSNGSPFFLTSPFLPSCGGGPGRVFLALYVFEPDGRFREARIDDLGTRSELDREGARALLARRLAELGPVDYCRIEVEPFELERFGVTF